MSPTSTRITRWVRTRTQPLDARATRRCLLIAAAVSALFLLVAFIAAHDWAIPVWEAIERGRGTHTAWDTTAFFLSLAWHLWPITGPIVFATTFLECHFWHVRASKASSCPGNKP